LNVFHFIKDNRDRYLELLQRYASAVMLSGSHPEPGSGVTVLSSLCLGDEILSKYLGSLVNERVFVPPLFFAFALLLDTPPSSGVRADLRAAVEVVEAVKLWTTELQKDENQSSDRFGAVNGAYFEKFVVRCRKYRFLTLNPSGSVQTGTLTKPYLFKKDEVDYSSAATDISTAGRDPQIAEVLALDRDTKDSATLYIYATVPNAPLVDIVEREGDVERWIQVKLTANSPFAKVKKGKPECGETNCDQDDVPTKTPKVPFDDTRKHFRAALMTFLGANKARPAETKMRRLEYFVVRPDALDGDAQRDLMKECFDHVIDEFKMQLDGLSVSYDFIPITSTRGEAFLGPFFALAVPSADRFDVTSWEQLPIGTAQELRQSGWTALKKESHSRVVGARQIADFEKTAKLCDLMRDAFHGCYPV
jgi:hypothetical protein